MDAVIWGMPLVSFDALRQAYFRDGKGKYGDIIWWPKGVTGRNQSLTPNTCLRYLYLFFNTKVDGPMVLDLPPAANGASFLGTIADAWQVPLTDVGFEGKGGKYLVLPPDYTGEVPSGYIPVRSKNTFPGIRSILAGNSEQDGRNGDALVKQIKMKSSAAEAHAWLLAQMTTFVEDWWPNSQWKVPMKPIAVKTEFKWTVANYFDVDTRGIAFASFFLPPAKLGGGSFYFSALFDSKGQPLRGENTYRLHVPANVPVSQFWAVTIYNSETSALFLDLPRPTLDSLDKGLRKNADGSVDIHFGPKAPAGQESNWIFTPAGMTWFPWFRFYGPEKAVFDKSWKMPDIVTLG